MPSITLTCAADAATWTNQNYGAGAGDHLPIGTWSSAVYRSAVRFTPPAWSAWTRITKATLVVYVSDHAHVGVRNSTITVRRQNESSLWTKSAGSVDCDSTGFSSSNTTQSGDLGSTATDGTSFASGTTANAKKSITVTAAVQYYFANRTSAIVFVFNGNSSSDYTELWSREKGSTYDAQLIIEYEVQSPPTAPTLGYPADGATVNEQDPTFTWTHNDPQADAQTAATVELDGVEYVVSGATASLPCPIAPLPRGSSHTWRVKTADAANGYGPYSALRTFTVLANPTVAIDATRRMEFSNGAPRLRVNWTSSQAQARYRVTVPSIGYDSGWLAGAANTILIPGNLVNGAATTVYVDVETALGLVAGSSQSFTPRWGLTTHRHDFGAAPTGWLTPEVVATVPPGASLVVEYGSNADGSNAPVAWYSSISAVGKRRYLFWRAWFIPSATASPVLDQVTLKADLALALLDFWYRDFGASPILPPWSVDPGEYVYGSRSVQVERTAANADVIFSKAIRLRAGRSYVLSGLMKSEGNSGCHIGVVGLNWQGFGPFSTETINESRDWFRPELNDTYRYRSPVLVPATDIDVYVYLAANGPQVGAQAWFDAVKLEESTIATPWSPDVAGATILDAGGVQIDGQKGGVFRYRGRDGALRSTVEGGVKGLVFGSDTEIESPAQGVIHVNGAPIPAHWG